MVKNSNNNERGQGMVEYGLILLVVLVVVCLLLGFAVSCGFIAIGSGAI